MNKERYNRIFNKLILLFILIILPLIVVSSIFLFTSNKRLEMEILQSIHEKTGSFIDKFDSVLFHIGQSAGSVTNHSELLKISYIPHLMNNYERAVAIAQFREYISDIKSVYPYISNIRVYVISMLHAYNADGYVRGSVQPVSGEEYDNLVRLKTENTSPVFYYDDRLLMLFPSSIRNPANIVEIEFSINEIKKAFASNYEDAFYIYRLGENFELDNIVSEGLKAKVFDADYENGIAKIVHEHTQYHAFYVPSSFLDAAFIQIVPDELILEPMQLSVKFTVTFLIVIFLCIILYLIGARKLIHNPLTKLVNAFQSVQKGDFNTQIHEKKKSEFSYLYSSFNDMSLHLSRLIDEVYQYKLLLQDAELKQLQAQINPHFLYNSFFMLQRTMKRGKTNEAIRISKELGIYFKYITRNGTDVVHLKDEYEHAKIYANFQAMRFEGRIKVEFGIIPENYEDFPVPRLILQPILENAFIYGLENKVSDGFLRVRFVPVTEKAERKPAPEKTKLSGTQILITIEDNGDDLSDEELMRLQQRLEHCTSFADIENTGIINIYKRIRFFYKNQSSMIVKRSDLGGMKVEIYLKQKEDSEICTGC